MVDTLVQAAAQVFSQEGFDGASTNSVAERAGVSIGSLYQYFPNKLALLEAVNESYIIGLWITASRACRNAHKLPWLDALRSIVAAKVDYHIKDRRLFGVLQNELPASFPTGADGIRTRQLLEKELRDFLLAHQTTIRIDVDRAVHMLPVVGKGIIATMFLSNPEDLMGDRIVDEVTKVLNHYLTGPEAKSL